MKILVQKFGGTSVSTEKNRKLVVKKVKCYLLYKTFIKAYIKFGKYY